MAQTLGDIGDRVDLVIKQGATFGPFSGFITNPNGSPVDLTGCELRAQLRRRPSEPAVNFDIEITDAVGGEFTLQLAKETTAGLTSPPKYVWDFELEDALGRVSPICYGDVQVSLEVTHA